MKKTIQFIHESLSEYYETSEIESFKLLIFEFLFGFSRKDIIINANKVFPDPVRQKVTDIVSRLKSNEPIQYILGETEFYGYKFHIKPGVLIPRFETEELVDLIIKRKQNMALKILDIGTGSGCIAISLKKQLPKSDIWCCDISCNSLQITKENAKLNEVEINIEKFDILSHEPFTESGFDLIVSNPPYVTENEKSGMKKNVIDNEPSLALFVPDNDPLLFYRSIILQAQMIMNIRGELFFEINEMFGERISAIIEESGFSAEIVKDINGKDRFAIAKPVN